MNNQAFSKIWIIVFLVILLAVGIFAWRYWPKEGIKAPKEEVIEDETADWKTYRNEEYGFEVKYPRFLKSISTGPNLEQQKLDKGGTISGTTQPSYDTVIFSDENNEEQFKVEIFHLREENLSKDEYIYLFGPCDNRFGFDLTETNIISVNNIEILQRKGIASIKGEPASHQVCYYFKNYNNNLIVLSSDDDSMLRDIVSTLRLFKVDETADWQTYRNEEYGFAVKYPKDEKISYEGKTEYILQPLKINFRYFRIIVWDNSQKLAVEDYFLKESSCVQNKSICEYLDQGYSFETIKVGEVEGFTTSVGVKSQIFVATTDERYIIEFLNLWPTNEEKTEIFNQILSTFRFLG